MCIEFLTFILKMNNIKKICDRYVLLIILLSILCFFSGGLLASPLDADSFFTVDIPEGWSIEARDKGSVTLLSPDAGIMVSLVTGLNRGRSRADIVEAYRKMLDGAGGRPACARPAGREGGRCPGPGHRGFAGPEKIACGPFRFPGGGGAPALILKTHLSLAGTERHPPRAWAPGESPSRMGGRLSCQLKISNGSVRPAWERSGPCVKKDRRPWDGGLFLWQGERRRVRLPRQAAVRAGKRWRGPGPGTMPAAGIRGGRT